MAKASASCRCSILFACLLVFALTADAQKPSPDTLKKLHALAGRLLAESRSAKPLGHIRLTGYSIEELSLQQPVEVGIKGRKTTVKKAWRVNIFGGPFPIRAMIPTIWVDKEMLGYGLESEDLKKLSVIVFDRSLLPNGGVISVSYGAGDDERTEFPERLNLNR